MTQSDKIPTILLVDCEENLTALETTLKDPNRNLLLATNGNEALRLFNQNEIALVLLGTRIPGTDGVEVAKLICGGPISKETLVILMAEEDEELIFNGYKAGAVDILTTPLDEAILKKKVQVFLQIDQQRRLLQQQTEQLSNLAQRDALTGLPNRRQFEERLEDALARAQRDKHLVALLFIDLDDFKIINDTLGHNIGDEVLKVVARRLKRCVRAVDSVCRLGGDEFTIILEGMVDGEHVSIVAERILEAIRQSIKLEAQEVSVKASIGAALYPKDTHDTTDLLRKADIAMYRAKEHGRDMYQFFGQK
jgi:diguanylate cyclase